MNGLLWVDMFFGFMIAMVITVPRSAIRKYLAFAIFGGFGVAIFVSGLLVPVFGLWKFNHTDIFSLDEVPIFIVMAWVPILIVYSYFLNRFKKKGEVYAYMAAFSLATGLYVHWLVKAGFLFFLNWNSLYTVLMAFLLYIPVTVLLVKNQVHDNNSYFEN